MKYFKSNRGGVYYESIMIRLSCKESGLECDYVAEGETKDDVLKNISEHSIITHNLKAPDIYEHDICVAFLCQAIGKIALTGNVHKRD